jgi:hypothetical protein
LSVIIICQFLLDIRQSNKHPNGISSTSLPIQSFQAAAQCFHNAIVEEFGDSNFAESFGEEPSQGDVELEEMHSQHIEAVIDIAEFLWATGEIRVSEASHLET